MAVRAVLAAYGDPLYATSANLSGEPAAARLEEVDPRVLEAVDMVVGGEPGTGEASAVVDLSGGRTRLLRATRELTEEALERLAHECRDPGLRALRDKGLYSVRFSVR